MGTRAVLLAGDFGTSMFERQLSGGARNAFASFQRALCNFGGCIYNPDAVHSAMYHGNTDPSVKDVKKWLDEYIRLGVAERFKAPDGELYLFVPRYLNDNYHRSRCVPSIPRPRSLSNKITVIEWNEGQSPNVKALFKKKRRVLETTQNLLGEGKGEGEDELQDSAVHEDILSVFNHYKDKIQSGCRPTDKALRKIRTRLNEFSVDQLKKAVDNRAGDAWFMQHNASRGPAWFFESEDRIDGYVTGKPRKSADDMKSDIAEEEE